MHYAVLTGLAATGFWVTSIVNSVRAGFLDFGCISFILVMIANTLLYRHVIKSETQVPKKNIQLCDCRWAHCCIQFRRWNFTFYVRTVLFRRDGPVVSKNLYKIVYYLLCNIHVYLACLDSLRMESAEN